MSTLLFQCFDILPNKMLRDGIIESSTSPLRAQVVVVNHNNHKKCTLIQTINNFSSLDTYPMSRMQNLANSVAQNNWLSSLDLNGTYDRVHILPKDRVVYSVRSQQPVLLVQINTIGLKNAVPLFQSVISETV